MYDPRVFANDAQWRKSLREDRFKWMEAIKEPPVTIYPFGAPKPKRGWILRLLFGAE